MAKNAKSEALKKKLGNVIECAKCGSRKHKTKEHNVKSEKHTSEADEKEVKHTKEEDEEENGDEK